MISKVGPKTHVHTNFIQGLGQELTIECYQHLLSKFVRNKTKTLTDRIRY